MSEYNKEQWNNVTQIYPFHYGKSVKMLSELVEEAKRDFPDLIDELIEVVVFAGDRKKYVHGIRFNTTKANHKDYFQWDKSEHLEPILN